MNEKSVNIPTGSLSYFEIVGLLFVLGGSLTVVCGVEWFINSIFGAYICTGIGLAIVSLSGKDNLRRVKRTSYWEGVGIGLIGVINLLFGYFQLEALQTLTYQILAMGLIFIITIAVAYRD